MYLRQCNVFILILNTKQFFILWFPRPVRYSFTYLNTFIFSYKYFIKSIKFQLSFCFIKQNKSIKYNIIYLCWFPVRYINLNIIKKTAMFNWKNKTKHYDIETNKLCSHCYQSFGHIHTSMNTLQWSLITYKNLNKESVSCLIKLNNNNTPYRNK